jgi:mono/diheme cytochrome c family protein
MKNIYFAVAIIAAMSVAISLASAHDQANGEKLFKSKCAGCHGADAAGKPAVKSPSIKGKTADDIQKEISTSSKHAGLKSLTTDQIKEIAAFLGTLK